MPKSYFDAYVYMPKDDAGSSKLEELASKEARVTEGTLGNSEFVIAREILDNAGKPVYISFGKEISIPYGVSSQPQGCQNGLRGFKSICAILIDSAGSNVPGYRESVEKIAFASLGVGAHELGHLEYLGLFSGECGKIVKD